MKIINPQITTWLKIMFSERRPGVLLMTPRVPLVAPFAGRVWKASWQDKLAECKETYAVIYIRIYKCVPLNVSQFIFRKLKNTLGLSPAFTTICHTVFTNTVAFVGITEPKYMDTLSIISELIILINTSNSHGIHVSQKHRWPKPARSRWSPRKRPRCRGRGFPPPSMAPDQVPGVTFWRAMIIRRDPVHPRNIWRHNWKSAF